MFKRGKLPVSDHYNGTKFFNSDGPQEHSFRDFMKIAKEIQRARWPAWVELESQAAPRSRLQEGLEYSVINHATVLIQFEGLNIITDPVYSERVSPVSFLGPKRVHRPGIAFEDLPPIDLVLISHNHYDHLDINTLRSLEKKFKPRFLTSLGNELFLRKLGLSQVTELDWWESEKLSINTQKSVTVHFVPAQHFSSRGLHDRNKTLWGGFVLESVKSLIKSHENLKVYFAGDTGYGSFFKEIHRRLGPMTLSFIPIGAYEPRWFMKPVHMNPEDAVLAHIDLQSKLSVGIHFGCFKLTTESIIEPALELRRACERLGVNEADFRVPMFGQVLSGLK